MAEEEKNVAIPAQLYDAIDKRVKETEFSSVEEYVTFVLEEVLKDDDDEIAFSPEDEEEVKKRLRALGYLD